MKQKKSLLCRGKECVINHVRIHRKVYVRSSIVSWTLVALTILILSFWMSFFQTSTIWSQEEKALLIFHQIDDIAHQREKIIEDLWYTMPQKERFHTIEKQFHEAKDLYQKYEIAKELDKIIHVQDAYLDEIGYSNLSWDENFHQLEEGFDQIK